MELRFRKVGPGEVEQELTQKDQFNTDSVPLAATLVRESIQNSTDARFEGAASHAEIRISFKDPDVSRAAFWRAIFRPLRNHLVASGIDSASLNLDAPNFLVVEDFGTTGLTGNFESKDDQNFNDFWRRVGRSHKGGTKGGSWGLGKLVFPISSEIRTFFGSTIRVDDPGRQLLMGQTILATHRIDTTDYVPHGFFATHDSNGFQRPVLDSAFISQFAAAVGFTRKDEPGLSIAIPFPRPELVAEKLIPLIIENYFFPILTGQLRVIVAGQIISAETFDEVARTYRSAALGDGHLIAFIREISRARRAAPMVVLPEQWASRELSTSISEDTLGTLREAYDSAKLITVRVPMILRQKDNNISKGYFDLFLRRAPDDVPATALKPLFIRGSITVPNEESNFRYRRAFAALEANEPNVSRFLRDAENPAHTSWNGNAEKLTTNWKAGAQRLREIRRILAQLHQLLDQAIARLDADALKALLHLNDAATARTAVTPNPTTRPPIVPPINPSPKLFDISKRSGGFTVKGASSLTQANLPMQIAVQAAYDLPTGNPLKKHSQYDFNFRLSSEIKIIASGLFWSAPEANKLLLDIKETNFSMDVVGFDGNRDLVISASRLEDETSL